MNNTKVTLISFFIISCVFLFANDLLAQKNIHSPKAKERMDMVKKMKMIEAMELNETKSEKFLVKFNSYSKQLDEKRKQQQELVDKLNDAVKNNSKELSSLTEQLLNLQNEISKINYNKFQELRGILSEIEFAKYLIFENKFMREVFSCFMNYNNDEVKGKKAGKMKKDTDKIRKENKNN